MKLILVFTLMASWAFGALPYTQIIMSEQKSEAALVIHHAENRLYFQKCTIDPQAETQVNLQGCVNIGAAEGYTQMQIEKRIEQLKLEKQKRFWIQATYVLVGVGAGFLGAGTAGAQYALANYKANMYVYIGSAYGAAVLGGSAGLAVTLLTKDLLADFIQGGDPSSAYKLLTQNNAQVVVMKDSLSHLVQDLNFALIGINK